MLKNGEVINLKFDVWDCFTLAMVAFIIGFIVGEKMVYVDFAQAAERIATEGD